MKRHAEKLPEWEEICAVAMSVQNMHLAAEAMGIGGFWSSHTWCKRARDSQVYRFACQLTFYTLLFNRPIKVIFLF